MFSTQLRAILATLAAFGIFGTSYAGECDSVGSISIGSQAANVLDDGSVVLRAKMNINIDGSARAYHLKNRAGGALIHLCNAGEVFLPDGSRYQGSESNETCTGKFMTDVAAIGAAGWNDPTVGAVRWFGVLGQGRARVGGNTVEGVVPVLQADGFFVSPTALIDPHFPPEDQRRYVEPLTVPAGVIRNSTSLTARGVVVGTFGVAIDPVKNVAVPFIVGDTGPRVGEGTPALARQVAGLAIDPGVEYSHRYDGVVDTRRVIWVFFGGNGMSPPFTQSSVADAARAAFDAWGGETRLAHCVARSDIPD
ncbi:hypothetical protein [Devosia sp. Root105]|uniref:hypothetical protein n=1 Tax=Devosia sp. Root105 TaxID=1736423 RepID=UPI0006F5F61E|nr:hypothetical protein [Devosia sp. Root105]KQU95037.1 hypothetical protein ASC68_17875 [Devosia sp. Root105]